MQTTVEKRKGSLDYLNVLGHLSALKYVKFHQQIARKIARKITVQRTEVEEDGDPSKLMLMQIERGVPGQEALQRY